MVCDVVERCGLAAPASERERVARRALDAAVAALGRPFLERVAADDSSGWFDADGPRAVADAAALNGRVAVAARLAFASYPPPWDESAGDARRRLLAVVACRALLATTGGRRGELNGYVGARLDRLDVPTQFAGVASQVERLNADCEQGTPELRDVLDAVTAALDALAPETSSARVVLHVAQRRLVVDTQEYDLSAWRPRWDELVDLAKRRAAAPGEKGGARPFEKNAIGRLRAALRSLRAGLDDLLIEQVARGRYRMRLLPVVLG